MIPIAFLANQIANILATDVLTLANASACKLGLIVAPFVPSVNRVMGDLTISSAASLVPIPGVSGSQQESIDPVNGQLLVEMKTPAGGWRWETPDPFTGPVTVYGFALGNNAMDTLYGTIPLLNPIILNAPNQTIDAGKVAFRIDPTKIT